MDFPAFDPFSGVTSADSAQPSIFDVQRRQKLAEALLNNQLQNAGPVGALANTLAGSGAGYQNRFASQEQQQGLTNANAALGKALSGGYDSIQQDPSAYITALGNPFLSPGAAAGTNAYMQNQNELHMPQPINLYSPGYYNRATGQTSMIDVTGGNAMPVGTTGNPAIDPTADGYSTKIIGNTGVTQATIDQAGQVYNATGHAPAIGRGPQGLFARNAVMNRAAEMMGGTGSIIQNSADLKASGSSLTSQTQYANNIERAFNTATDTFNALNTFMQQNGVNPSQFPDINQFGNYLQSHGKDAPGIIAAYNAQLQTLRQEYSQVLAKGGQRSVETDREAAQLIPQNLSPAQLGQVQAQIKIDSDNAINEARNQVGKISSTIGSIGRGSSAAPAVSSKVLTYNPATGELE